MKKILFWIVYNVPLGRLAPYVLGLAFGTFPKRVKNGNSELKRKGGAE